MVIYLHGFASSSQSGKATFLGKRFREKGERFLAPDLNQPDFSTLTITRMLEQTRALIDAEPEPVALIGSSLGAFVSVSAAAMWPERIKSLVLMAPALDLRDLGGEQLAAWKESGQMTVFHFAYGRVMQVGYALYEDAQRYDTFNAQVPMPVLIFQGRRDTVVSPATVEAWSRARPNVRLRMLDDDHQLAGSLDEMWEEMSRFGNVEVWKSGSL